MKIKSSIFLTLNLLILSGCSLNMGRSYLSEMEQDDSGFYSPKEDFPVMAGDSGRFWTNNKERKARTPATEYELARDNQQKFLKSELKELESSQSQKSLELYENHKHKFGSISEKIYFLNLPTTDRVSYLESRGFIERPHQDTLSQKMRSHVRGGGSHYRSSSGGVSLGMDKDAVRQNWGSPNRVEVAGNPSNENERWVYSVNGATKYIYFESGVVQGWE